MSGRQDRRPRWTGERARFASLRSHTPCRAALIRSAAGCGQRAGSRRGPPHARWTGPGRPISDSQHLLGARAARETSSTISAARRSRCGGSNPACRATPREQSRRSASETRGGVCEVHADREARRAVEGDRSGRAAPAPEGSLGSRSTDHLGLRAATIVERSSATGQCGEPRRHCRNQDLQGLDHAQTVDYAAGAVFFLWLLLRGDPLPPPWGCQGPAEAAPKKATFVDRRKLEAIRHARDG